MAPSKKAWKDIRKQVTPFGVKDMQHLKQEEGLFLAALRTVLNKKSSETAPEGGKNLLDTLQFAYIRGDEKGLSSQLYYLFRNFLLRNRFSQTVANAQRRVMDLRYPWEWFPATRALQRTIHLHVGPTNSGKTYHALKALENAETGVYCGPLRLLAHEVYTRLIAKEKPCALITGEEQRYPEDTNKYFVSCTVEMTPLNQVMDVAVIDEIQMIADHDRGSAWTAAFLGVQAKEVHLCGEERTVDLIKSICASIGDTCVVHRYERLTPLQAAPKALGKNLKKLEKGDCIVAFSKFAIHALKAKIERETGRRCAIIYGSLPPETRTQQAALFNDPNNDYDFLVASDAVGMGLNLEIRRVIFESLTKHDGVDYRDLSISEIRQIGGRAGRFKTARDAIAASHTAGEAADAEKYVARATREEEKVGFVTTLDPMDLEGVRKNLWRNARQLQSAAIMPPMAFIERFASFFPSDMPLSFVLMKIHEVASLSERFQMSVKDDFLTILDAIHEFPLSISDRLVVMTAPVPLRSWGSTKAIKAVARCLAEKRGGHILDMEEINLEVLNTSFEGLSRDESASYLSHLEALHHAVVLYLWMSYRFPRIFVSQSLAFHVRDQVHLKINEYLAQTSFNDETGEGRRSRQRLRAARRHEFRKSLLGDRAEDLETSDEGPGRWTEEGHEEPLTDEPTEAAEDMAPLLDEATAALEDKAPSTGEPTAGPEETAAPLTEGGESKTPTSL